jgi:hypothetical protein
MMKHIIAGFMSAVVCSAVPIAVSAESLSYRGAGYGVSHDWFERNSSLYNVAEDIFKDRPALPPVSYSGRDQAIKESTSEKSADSMSKDDHHLAPSPSISPSVHGHRELGLSGDPSVKDLSIMDRSGFAPPGSYTGSERR